MTPDHAGLYRAICADPDDDLPRLAFADLLDEHGDADRAAFVRTQVELARYPEHDPLWVKCRAVSPEVLAAWHMAHTLPPLPPGFDWSSFAFRRGFPWAVGVRSLRAFVDRGDELFAAAPVQALDVDCNREPPDLAALAGCPHLERVVRLVFRHGRLGPDPVVWLTQSSHATRLTELAFEADGIDPDGLRALAGSELFARLAALELRRNVIPAALLVDALAAAPERGALRRLSLPYAYVTQYDAAHLFALPALHGLDSLDLGDNPLEVDGVRALAASGAVAGLSALNLSHARPGVPGVRALAAADVRALRHLDLSANRLGPTAVQLLASAPRLADLRVLKLGTNPVGDTGARHLAESPRLAGLLELDLSDADVGDAGAAALADSPHLANLLRLDLRNARGRPLRAATRGRLRERFGPRVAVSELPGEAA